jgi:heme oxygenase (biliverdin-IX-beta and delta-forming)
LDASSPSIHADLRRETAPLHRAVEEALDLLAPDLTRSRYERVLEVFFGFYEPIETSLRALAIAPPGFDLPNRSALLERDLRRLGRSASQIDALPRCEDVPRPRRVEHLAGILYVLEGASLGGRWIAEAVERRLGLDATNGAGFFHGHGIHTADRWRRFLAWLDSLASGDIRRDLLHASACDTFASLEHWAHLRGIAR